MSTPPYPIPSSRRLSNYELARYVKHEFNDNESHWFRSEAAAANGSRNVKRPSLFRRLLRPTKRKAPDIVPTIVPCAVLVEESRKDNRAPVKARRF